MKLRTLALGAAAGYSVARVLEARANGVALGDAFSLSNLLKPISAIRATLPPAPVTASNQVQVIDVTPAA